MDRLPDVTTTQTDSLAKRTSSAAHEEGRFVSGTLLGGRYRIIGLLGEGGMGEVYRATDLALGQSVALKFLPETAAGNDRLLERFQNEVRVARQVSHPNVCRMYDIGEVEGAPFLSMEYVDGEDLATLLQRIGRLPADKAIEIARKLCAGLQAAHDKGVIHRDLKPQNIMLNKKGEVLILDFGLAAIAEQIAGAEVRNGTPAYMSPEQLKGTGVTARSDLYSLGLVLYELFTGKRPYAAGTMQELIALQEAAEPSSLTSLASDVDPAVERVVRRCLDPDPLRRPASALAVAAGLPGGDPLAAALAAGETPSPELVAAAGGTDGLAPRYAITCLAVILVCLAGIPWLRQSKVAMLRAPAEFSPEVLAQKARDVTARFGYARKPADRALRLVERKELVEHLRKLPAPEWDRWLAAEGPGVLRYREAQAPLVAEPLGDVTALNPAPVQPGMVQVDLDSGGRLRYFRGVPYGLAEQPAGPPPDVAEVFRAAGLDLSQFAPVELARSPLGVVDQVLAWKGRHPVIPQTELVVQVGSWRGQVTEFRTIWPWMKEGEQAGASWIQRAFEMTGLAMALFFTLLLSRRNWKAGRVDRRGALRLAIVSGGAGSGFVAGVGTSSAGNRNGGHRCGNCGAGGVFRCDSVADLSSDRAVGAGALAPVDGDVEPAIGGALAGFAGVGARADWRGGGLGAVYGGDRTGCGALCLGGGAAGFVGRLFAGGAAVVGAVEPAAGGQYAVGVAAVFGDVRVAGAVASGLVGDAGGVGAICGAVGGDEQPDGLAGRLFSLFRDFCGGYQPAFADGAGGDDRDGVFL
jgi:serine/threonine-protein kinase